MGDQKRAYRRNGIKEYIVWQVFEQKLNWFYLQEGEYVSLPVEEDGVIKSLVFPGLWSAVVDLFSRNIGKVLAVLQTGLAASEHKAFVQGLAKYSVFKSSEVQVKLSISCRVGILLAPIHFIRTGKAID